MTSAAQTEIECNSGKTVSPVCDVRAKGVGNIAEWKALSSAQRSKLGRPVLLMTDVGH